MEMKRKTALEAMAGGRDMERKNASSMLNKMKTLSIRTTAQICRLC